jgi:uncharacterized membrane protein YeaQ/YmgE (transglycosylase-associated protein family)
MDIAALIVQLVLGAVGGLGVGQFAKNMSLGMIGNVIAGAVGGVGGTWLAALVPGLDTMLGAGDTSALVAQGVSALIGGGILTAIAGMIRKSMGGSQS